MLIQCLEPFSGETPHMVLAKHYLTPAALFFVRNHMPVPCAPTPASNVVNEEDYKVFEKGAED